MDENKSPQDILNEIFEKSGEPTPPPQRPTFEYPSEDDPLPAPPPDEPTEKHGAEEGARPFPWLGVMLGAALLVMGVCLLQLVRMNHRLDELQQAVEAVQSVDSLREENGRLQVKLDQTERNAEHLRQTLDDTRTGLAAQTAQKKRLDYLWYVGQFIDHGDYPMAALAATLSAREYFSDSFMVDPQTLYPNLEQIAQYRAYCRGLADKGYLEMTYGAVYESTPTVPTFPEQWDPEQNPDMAALGILWCALDENYVEGASEAAAQYLINYQWYPLYSSGESGGDCYPQRILDTASDYTIHLYEQLIQDLTRGGWLAETDGILYYSEDQFLSDILYSLPFHPPGGIPVT
ncbi:MAG: hypothetical protein HDT33_03985 [Clostridiales bacterium]|nr:hypothetical protein [Clostridiales bacterium]